MRGNFRTLILIAIAVAAIAPSAAGAADAGGAGCTKDYSRNSVDGGYCASPAGSTQAAALSCTKDYSRNSVDGGYCVSSVSSPIVAAAPHASAGSTSDGFSWVSAAAGAGAALLLIVGAFGLTAVVRRRQGPSMVAQEGSATIG